MEIRVLETNFIALGMLSAHAIDSVLWVERYDRDGEFEIYAKYTEELYDLLRIDRYLSWKESNRMMVIEGIEIKTDPENGDKLVVTGRTLESLLDRRIILRQIQIDTSLQSGIQAILNADVINSIYPERNFPGFVFSTSTDPLVTTPTLKAQFYSQNLLEVIKTLVQQENLGFRLFRTDDGVFDFALYAGKDRSYAQSTNPYVVFSPNFDNLIKSEYFRTRRIKKNYVLVSGDPTGLTGLPARAQVWTADVGTGLNRLEMFSDASDLSRYVEGTSTPIDETTYLAQLTQRGWEELAKYSDISGFDGQVDLSRSYKYGVDFNLGDIVQMVDLYGHGSMTRVVEMTFSHDVSSGYTVYPTLVTI